MNKVILMGRLSRDPELRYGSGANATAVCRYSLAVDRDYKRDGEPTADFINIVAFGKAGEFANQYFRKGMMVAVVGSLRISSYDDRDGNKRWSTDVIVSEQHFAESKAAFESRNVGGFNQAPQNSFAQNGAPVNSSSDFAAAGPGFNPAPAQSEGFAPITGVIENSDDLPF